MAKKEESPDEGYSNPRYRWYLEEKRFHEASRQSQSDSFDSAILTLSSGSFGVSIAFLAFLKESVQPGTVVYLVLAWISFALAIVSTLVSFKISERAHDMQIDELTNLYSRPDYRVKSNRSATLTGVINYISLGLFVAGLSLLSVFIITNLK